MTEQDNQKVEEVRVNVDALPVQKNTDGHLGPKCGNCGGFGYTLTIGGPSQTQGCHDCGQTGVAVMSPREIQNELIGLKTEIKELKELIIKFASEKLSGAE